MPSITETTLRLALAAVLLSVAWMPMASVAEEVIVDEQVSRLQEDSLRVLTRTLKTYVVTDLPATQALEQIWVEAGGEKNMGITFSWESEAKHPEPRISLNLKNVPAQQVITYIAELSQSHWHIQGRPGGLSLDLSLQELTLADCSPAPVVVVTAPLSKEGAQHLGISAEMHSAGILERLKLYGVKVTGKDFPAATYAADTGMLAVIIPKDEGPYVEALARLADRGQLTPAKP